MLSAHTPGPWIVDDSTQQGDAALMVLNYNDRQRETHLANARLIAAAPALLRRWSISQGRIYARMMRRISC